MGDWRTLHFFDDRKYKEEIAPRVTDIESYLSDFLDEYRLSWLDGYRDREEVLRNTIAFVPELNAELNIHPALLKIQKRKPDEVYDDFIRRKNRDFEQFFSANQSNLEFFEFILIETIFSSVADFNPHFKLGKWLIESIIGAKKGSIAEELLGLITGSREGGILDLVDGGIINWLSQEEVELLFLDRENIFCKDHKFPGYLKEFKDFLQMAAKNQCGLITLRNPDEYRLSHLQPSPNPNEAFIKKAGFKNILINRG